ncbi:MAG: YraN family protein [Chloroflexota bacterium]|nr:YraN family protein [Chloroflexota bacterium]MDE2896298.1 YraN family protein [Chloroflexota bacterium]
MPPRPERQPDHKQSLGAAGEDLAAAYLEARGYRIVERNYRRRWGEADIIALDSDGTHVIVEVRSRSDRRYAVEAAQSIGPRKQRQLRRLAHGLLSEQEVEFDIRVDVMIIAPDDRGRLTVVAHIADAIEDGPFDD